jgi:type IV secretory pathway VirD2 relaxase
MASQRDELLEPEFRFKPRITGRRGRGDAHRSTSLSRLLKGRGGGAGAKTSYDIGPGRQNSRRCVVKSHYVPMHGGGRDAARLHLAYLERDGVERDGSPGRLYGADEAFEKAEFAEPIKGEKVQFRFIVSPEDGREVDLRTFTRELMAQMEADLGRPLIWTAVNHHNTDHPHAHVVVRGVDRDGKELRIPSRYVKQDMRARAEQIMTRELGLRTELDIAQQRSNEIGQERLTSIDRQLARLASPDGRLLSRELAKLPAKDRSTLLGRLATIASLGLARRRPQGAWDLVGGWQEALTKLGQRNDVIKRLHQVAGGDVSRYRFLEPSELTVPIEGVVRGKGLHDELTGEVFAGVETASGETHYVRLDAQAAGWLRDGDVVRVAQAAEPWVKPTDHVVARIAELNAGIYDPAAHLLQLSGLPQKAAPPADLVAGNVRRLERLERYGLVTRLPDGRWRIPPDLVQKLQARETTHPRHRLRVHYAGASVQTQANYPGPTWLDKQPLASPERARWGFGAELDASASARVSWLRSKGIEPGAPDQAKRLDAMECLHIGRRLAEDRGLFHVEGPTTFRGTFTACPPQPSGRAFAQVVDERTKRLVIVPATMATARLEGRLVEVTTDHNQQVVVRPAPRLARGEE